jgi:predicted ATPase
MPNPDQSDLFPELVDDYPTSYLPAGSSAPHIEEVQIRNFKSIEDSIVRLAPFSVLTGVNNSGKSTILQAIWVAFECLRLCVDRTTWNIAPAGRALAAFDFLPANEPEDLWFKGKYRAGSAGRPIQIKISLANGFWFETHINLYFGAINIRVKDWNREPGSAAVQAALTAAPILIPGHVEIAAHEESKVPAQIHRFAQSGQLSAIIRNVLMALAMTDTSGQIDDAFEFVARAIRSHFGIELQRLTFDPERDLEIRAPYSEHGCQLDIVSAGSGLHQILKLGAFIAWRRARIVLLDEPDAHLHTSLQSRLSLFLHKLATEGQIQFILATHSRDLISRSPLESVIPVDASRREIGPISQIEHLLTEFRRLGPVGNFDVALLYQTKRCLFVEGSTDVTWIPLIGAKLNFAAFTGPEQFVLFDFKGAEKFTLVKDLADLFQRVIGSPLSWFVLRDREASTQRVLDHIRNEASARGINNYHVWTRYSIENYLLEPTNVIAAVRNEGVARSKTPPSDDRIRELLDAATSSVLQDARTTFITETQNYFIRHQLEEQSVREKATEDALQYLDQCSTLDAKLKVLPGFKIYGQFVERLQNECGITLRFESLIESLEPDTTPSELRDVLSKIESLTPAPNTTSGRS